MKPTSVSMELGGKTLRLESGYLAKQAGASVVATLGETSVFAAVTTADPRPGIDFFPLSVDYREKLQAAGKFPGGFMKREGRPTTKEILTCRLIDRPARPMFPEAYKDEVQICSFVLQADRENDPDMAAMNAAFAALHLCDCPFVGPLGAVRVVRYEGKLIVMPTIEESKDADMDLIVAGNHDAITMVEGCCNEVSEADFLDALDFAHKNIRQICEMMDDFQDAMRIEKTPYIAPEIDDDDLFDEVVDEYAARFEETIFTEGKHERSAALSELRAEAIDRYVSSDDSDAADRTKSIKAAWKYLEKSITRRLLFEGKRVDGRGPADIRDIDIQVGIQNRLHGSAVFTRGETQALVVATLGTMRDQQIVDGLGEEFSKKFDFQYNFPPYCVGECKPIRGVSRREIGHGNLAERSLLPVLPDPGKFPYTIRLISDILESNGSSSMASVCGGTLAMMNAGVPILQPVAGIAMGLCKEGDDVVILSDILGSEDHFGDMDFKVSGTGRGITAVQMDIKVKGLSKEIMRRALDQARDGRLHILKKMLGTVPRVSEEISSFAPRLMVMSIPPEKIGLIIGPGGKNIKRLQEETGANLEIEDDGTVHISCRDSDGAKAARQQIELITAEVEVGKIYNGRVVSIKDFGAFIEILPGQEGLCHVSELSDDYVSDVGEVVSIGDTMEVKVIARDEQDRIKLSRKAVLMGDDGNQGGGGGDRGPRGRDDDRGPRGRDGGDRGPRGRDDDRGPRGRDGDRGPRGRGRDDDRGPRGPRGRDGDRGPRGRDDDRGPRGRGRDDDRGPRGRDGDRGPRGRDDDRGGRGRGRDEDRSGRGRGRDDDRGPRGRRD
jgi:polyribonucleotide nucleotidyltransferase